MSIDIKTTSFIYNLVKRIHFTEKAARLGPQDNQYVFEVDLRANKFEIKKAIEQLFSVKVEKISTSVVKGKTKAFKNSRYVKSDWKKAYVTLVPGQDIDFMGGAAE